LQRLNKEFSLHIPTTKGRAFNARPFIITTTV
jgi:hypothetical protein